ncbi:MAG: hypothetical protein JWR38_1288 [Mucilaginibacter sp.]|nr:hypothetical protein [Mucilaginibacter sp.]
MKSKLLLPVLAMICMIFTQCKKNSELDSLGNKSDKEASGKQKVNTVMCADCAESTTKITGSQAQTLASTYAPLLKFDRATPDYPTSVENVWANTDPNSIVCNGTLVLTNRDAPRSKDFPTYYEVQQNPNDANKVFIDYWWTYKTQSTCFENLGSHDYDWEHIVIQVNTQTNRVITVTYFQHAGWYTRDWRSVAANTRVPVYVGKTAHGSYHFSNSISFPGYACSYYGDYRNPNGAADEVSTTNNLVEISCNITQLSFNGNWGTGVGKGPLYRGRAYWSFSTCNGHDGITGTDGCSQSSFPDGTQIGGI